MLTNTDRTTMFPTALAQLRADVAERQQARIAARTAVATYDDCSDLIVTVRAVVHVPPDHPRTWLDSRWMTVAVIVGAGLLVALALSVLLNLIP